MSQSGRRERGQPEPSLPPEADSAETREREERIDEILEASFPASDPPAWSSVRTPDDPPRSSSPPDPPRARQSTGL